MILQTVAGISAPSESTGLGEGREKGAGRPSSRVWILTESISALCTSPTSVVARVANQFFLENKPPQSHS